VKSVRVDSDGSVSVVDAAAPRIGSGEALMRMRACGICGSDLLDWYVRGKAGTVLGHEVVGEVVEVGEGVRAFAPGDRVVPHHHAPCSDCEACRENRPVHCREWRASRLDPGGMAELIRIPAGNLQRDTWKIPASLSDEEAIWTEPLATVVKAFSRAGFRARRSVLVIGLGSAGQLAVRLARERGARSIVGVDRVGSRLALARSAGAETIDVSRETLTRGAERISGGAGFDLVFVCPGKAEVLAEASRLAAPGGTLLMFTMAAAEERLSLPLQELYFREVSVVPSYSCGPSEMKEALDLLVSRRVPVGDLVTHRFPLLQAREAFARARDAEGSLKVVLTSSPSPGGRGTG
jgi:L-iditol 2-dehydrogenase